jgi:hypothetical protein
MPDSKTQSWYVVPLIFIIFAMAVVGFVPEKYYIEAADGCGDGDFINIADEQCGEYPYEDGNGVDETPVGERFTKPQDHYQTPYDWLRVDVQTLIAKAGGIQALGLPSSVDDEVKVFCFFNNNGQQDFQTLITKMELGAPPTIDFSESKNLITNLCNTFPPFSHGITELPVLKERG